MDSQHCSLIECPSDDDPLGTPLKTDILVL